LSIFSVVPVFALHYFLDLFPQFDILAFLQNQIHNQNTNYILLFISVGIVEEIVKQLILRYVDHKYLLIQTINDSIHYSLISALGFAFAENIFYISSIYSQLGWQQLIIPYLFRSIFTTAAHLIFSGFFGYFYGLAKFSMNITEQSRWTGKKHYLANLIGSIFKISRIRAVKELMIIRGLLIAIVLHAVFNFMLQLNQIIPTALYIAAGFALLLQQLRQKSGKLILVTDPTETRLSTMAETDEDVVIELIGMWFKDKRYVDVIHICERLAERDPDNKVIQLFKAKALDQMDKNSAYGKILNNMFPDKQKKKTLKQLAQLKLKRQKEPQQKPTLAPQKPQTETDAGTQENEDGTFHLDV
jgi:RsiW-degrading membrane proteinase PrsW (M82 family)